jgi:hypothetical protein
LTARARAGNICTDKALNKYRANMPDHENHLRTRREKDHSGETRWPAEKRKKVDLKDQTTGGAKHKKGKRASTKLDHEYGDARKRRDYGGEEGDERRRYPRRKPKGWKKPWPPESPESGS